MPCPKCHGIHVIKNGTIHPGKPKWKCKACGRQFVAESTNRRISDETKHTIGTLLLECISLAGYCARYRCFAALAPILREQRNIRLFRAL